ncbi:STAS domain-containing protein [Magnetofaba australis]|uniref:STAS domain-containing protein n=1 Tax=Magnetofaba australis TaxID=1472297 RepID=UPI001180F64D|nr:STAS domain-containing protein [Magnetofaba australis]
MEIPEAKMDIQVTNDHQLTQIALRGEFVYSTMPSFVHLIKKLHGSERYCVDLGKATRIDSSGMGALLLLRDLVGEDHTRVVLCNMQPRVRQTLIKANFHRLFTLSDACKSAA